MGVNMRAMKLMESGRNHTVNVIIIIIQFFIIYVPSQQPKGELQTQHSLDTGKYIICKQKLQASTGGRK
jgi:hypothetical protein